MRKLNGGRAIAYWQRQWVVSAAQITAWHRSTAWLTQTLEVNIPLHSGSILGDSLTDLTNAIANFAPSQQHGDRLSPTQLSDFFPETSPQRTLTPRSISKLPNSERLGTAKPKIGAKKPIIGQKSAESNNDISPITTFPSPEIEKRSPLAAMGLPAQVNQDLLTRLSSQMSYPSHGQNFRNYQPHSQKMTAYRPDMLVPQFDSWPRASPASITKTKPKSEEEQDWWQQITRRVKTSLNSRENRLSRDNTDSFLPTRSRQLLPTLTEQRKLTLEGLKVSQQWLSDYSAQFIPDQGLSSSKKANNSESNRTSFPQPHLPIAPSPLTPNPQPPIPNPQSPTPYPLPSLISLLTRPEDRSPTTILRRDPRKTAPLTDEDDLNQLAAQIQRILDEEARRHGIQV